MTTQTPSLSAARRATQGFFLVSGIAMASWAPMVPFAQARLGLDEAQLGLVLLCMGFGSVGAMPLAGYLSHRFGHRGVMIGAALVACTVLPVLSFAAPTAALVGALIAFGAGLGVVDVAMNAHAVDVERAHGRPMMSGFHALFSIGGLTGSAGVTALLAAHVPLFTAAIAVSALMLVVVATQSRSLWVRAPEAARQTDNGTSNETNNELTPQVVAPRGGLSGIAILLGGLCLVVFLTEGAMLDWSAVFLRDTRGVAVTKAGMGYVAFSIAMAAGRLLGDRITAALGPLRIVQLGSLVAAAGLALAVALQWPATSFAGFILVGFGASNIVPVLFSAAGSIPGRSAGVSIATTTALGYAGMLAGPAVIGLVARTTGLAIALGGVAGLLVIVAMAARAVLGRTQEGAR